MPTLPLLQLPPPDAIGLPPGSRVISNVRFPGAQRQREKFSPAFNRLRNVFGRKQNPLQLRDDPTSLAPDRVIVFEVAGTVANFVKATAKIPGLEFMGEY